ncbi:Uu.00g076080.m01.CDS01 [Anthostomella pinea]|uniref:Carboxylic ester hydrolase n=1 Tax=Anthostomella pinea TaxID=933095 RepID=A0AAI8VX03_9PEZI|nr:Uu.00g076080.m01.CDS01 [Anthostomella pinea]
MHPIPSAALFGILGSTLAACAPTAETSLGKIQGGKCSSTETNYFFSIPFANPPVDELRFKAPEKYTRHFNGTLDATKSTPFCIQFSSLFGESSTQSEDCLYLNVWAPAGASNGSNLPVKVWLYGGSNEGGGVADPAYDGCFSTTDSIMVSINYRLGPLGFLALKDLGLSGNFGTMDQIMGLEWVQENIAAFGGDPNKVLLFGQSAGATDTYTIATLEQAPKLMRAAAMESGGGRDLATVEEAQTVHGVFANALNCSTTDISCFRAASPAALQFAVAAMPTPGVPEAYTQLCSSGARTNWGPLVDGSLIPVSPGTSGVRVPSIFGSNTNDGSLFVLAVYRKQTFSIGQAEYDAFLTHNFGSLAPRVNATFPLQSSNVSAAALMTQIVTDAVYKCPAHRGLLAGARNGVPVWAYEFTHAPSCPWVSQLPAAILPYVGVAHSAEIPFVFNTTTALPRPDGNCSFTAKETALAGRMSRAWTDMAQYGRPGDEVAWPRFTEGVEVGVDLGHPLAGLVVGGVDYERCSQFWDQIDAAMALNQTQHERR